MFPDLISQSPEVFVSIDKHFPLVSESRKDVVNNKVHVTMLGSNVQLCVCLLFPKVACNGYAVLSSFY